MCCPSVRLCVCVRVCMCVCHLYKYFYIWQVPKIAALCNNCIGNSNNKSTKLNTRKGIKWFVARPLQIPTALEPLPSSLPPCLPLTCVYSCLQGGVAILTLNQTHLQHVDKTSKTIKMHLKQQPARLAATLHKLQSD